MNLLDRSVEFLVYRHTSPGGKQYVGITSKPVNVRWGKDGSGYRDNAHFYSAIQKYGWNNFLHEILATGLSLDEAGSMEQDLISKYNLCDPQFGYNQTSGGECSFPNDEVRRILSSKVSERCKDPEYRKKLSDSLKGHPVSDETRHKISEKNKGKLIGRPSPLKGRSLSPEQIAHRRGRPSWNKGLTASDDSRVKRIAESMKGRYMSPEWRENISTARKQLYSQGYCPIWVTNGSVETYVSDENNIPTGFHKGRLDRQYKYIHKNGVSKKIPESELQPYLDDGWILGRDESACQSVKRSLQRCIWNYDGCTFTSATELAKYLNSHGYPDIVGSTITSLYIKGFESSQKYSSLADKIVKEDVQ